MKFKSSTLILLVLALGLGGAVYFWERQGSSQPGEQAGQPIFDFKEDQVQALTLKTPQRNLSFSRKETPQKQGHRWLLKTPRPVPASDASIAYLLNLLVTTKSDRTLTALSSQRREFGLDQPLATVEVKLNNQETHQLVLGGPDFNHSVLYAQVDPPAKTTQDLKVLLVPTAFENAVNRPLSEWRSTGSDKSITADPN